MDYSSYLQKQGPNIKLSGDKDTQSSSVQSPSITSGLFSTIKGYMKLSTSEKEIVLPQDQSWISRISKKCEVEKSYKLFFLFLFLGLGITFFSFFFLPMILLSPKKFVSLFSLGSSITIFSFIFYYGTYDFLSMLFCKERRLYTIMFISSICLGECFSFTKSFFLLSLICSIVQMLIMFTFTLSFIPGGRAGITFMWDLVFSPIKRIFSSSGSALPI